MPKQAPPAIERLRGKLKEAPAPYGLQSPCKLFQGAKLNKSGHGGIWHNGKVYCTHRIAWEAVHGPIPIDQRSGKTFVVLHLCDQPACCNVDHMVLGSPTENMQDCIAKGRHATAQALSKLNKAVSLGEHGMSNDDIARKLSVAPCEIERLLGFHDEDASVYAAEKELHGEEVANSLRSYRLTASYGAVVSVMELMSLARHIRQLDLGV